MSPRWADIVEEKGHSVSATDIASTSADSKAGTRMMQAKKSYSDVVGSCKDENIDMLPKESNHAALVQQTGTVSSKLLTPSVDYTAHTDLRRTLCANYGSIRSSTQSTKHVTHTDIEPGTPVGIRCAQSILMSATQKSLSHFHTAGMSYTGDIISPSPADAMNNNYTVKNTSMKFDMHTVNGKPVIDIFTIRGLIVGEALKYFVNNIKINTINPFPEHENIWYEALGTSMYKGNLIRIYTDYNKMQQYGLTLNDLTSILFEQEFTWHISPDFMGMIDVEFPNSYFSNFLSQMGKRVCGTSNILSCDLLANNKSVVTMGSDILTVSRVPDIDKSTITSNNVKDVEKCFGIEAAAATLNKIIGSSVISDFMTRTGKVMPFYKNSRETRRKGLLTSMGFERPKDDVKHALCHTTDAEAPLMVYESVMTGIDTKYDFDVLQ